MNNPDFIAQLKFLTTEESGRKKAARSGYRPHIEFEHYPEYLTSGYQQYLDKEEVLPGEKVVAAIKILGTEYFSKRLYPGKKFKFCEGPRIVGLGTITEVLNTELIKEEDAEESAFNLNLFPADILDKIKEDFGSELNAAKRILQPYLLKHEHLGNPRIIRSVLFLASGNKEKLLNTIRNINRKSGN